MNKATRLLELARKRQASRWPGYKPLVEYQDGAYECDFVSPYTKSAGNVDATVMIILQDWSSHDRLSGERDADAIAFGHTPSLPTNRNLVRLLDAHFGLALADTYGTNLFPFVKSGGLSASIPTRDLERAAREFTFPRIDIIAPRLVISFGLKTFNLFDAPLAWTWPRPLTLLFGPRSRGGPRVSGVRLTRERLGRMVATVGELIVSLKIGPP